MRDPTEPFRLHPTGPLLTLPVHLAPSRTPHDDPTRVAPPCRQPVDSDADDVERPST